MTPQPFDRVRVRSGSLCDGWTGTIVRILANDATIDGGLGKHDRFTFPLSQCEVISRPTDPRTIERLKERYSR